MWRLKVIKWWEWLFILWALVAASTASWRISIFLGGIAIGMWVCTIGMWVCIYTNRVDRVKDEIRRNQPIKWDREEWE